MFANVPSLDWTATSIFCHIFSLFHSLSLVCHRHPSWMVLFWQEPTFSLPTTREREKLVVLWKMVKTWERAREIFIYFFTFLLCSLWILIKIKKEFSLVKKERERKSRETIARWRKLENVFTRRGELKHYDDDDDNVAKKKVNCNRKTCRKLNKLIIFTFLLARCRCINGESEKMFITERQEKEKRRKNNFPWN